MTLFDEPSRKPLPQPTFEDVTHVGRKGLASMIPFVGGPASELLGLLSSPVAQRRDNWWEDLERRLRDLEGTVKGFRFDDLGQNEQFVSATLQATQVALRTHFKEKLAALQNAVLNVAANRNFSDEQQGIFLGLVDALQPIHLRMLSELDKTPHQTFQISKAIRELQIHVAGLAEFRNDGILSLLEELGRANLVKLNEASLGPSIIAFEGRWTTEWGHQLLAFITAPGDKNGH